MVQEVPVPETYVRPSQFFSRRPDIPAPLVRLAYALIIGGLEDLESSGG